MLDTFDGIENLLMALLSTQAPRPTDEWLDEQIPAFEGRPEPRDRDEEMALRCYRHEVELGSADWRMLYQQDREKAERGRLLYIALKDWTDRYTEHRIVHIAAAKHRWAVLWAKDRLAEVVEWRRDAEARREANL